MPKNVQIPFELFIQLVRYHYLEDNSPELPGSILKGIENKLDAMVKHNLYSTYSNKQLSDEERIAAKKEYLKKAGIPDDFVWPGLKHPTHLS